MKVRSFVLAALVSVAGIAFGGTRTVSVTSADAAKGTLTFAFGGDAEKKILFAVRDATDKGANPSAWAEQCYVTVVLATTKTFTWNVPQDWRRAGGVVRFFFQTPDPSLPYDRRIEAIYPAWNASNLYYDTGLVPTQDSAATIDYKLPEGCSNEEALFGISGYLAAFAQTGRHFIFVPRIDTTLASYVTTTFGSGLMYGGRKRHKLTVQAGVSLDGVPQTIYRNDKNGQDAYIYNGTFTREMPNAETTMQVFAYILNQASRSPNKSVKSLRVYGFEMTDLVGGERTAVCRLIPCVKDGVCYFYDEVREQLIAPSSSNGFKAEGDGGPALADAAAENPDCLFTLPAKMGRRLVTGVSYVDGEYKLRLAIEAGTKAKWLTVCEASRDLGANPSAWGTPTWVTNVAANVTEVLYAIPEKWRGEGHVLRFFLQEDDAGDKPYDTLREYVTKQAGSGAYYDTGIVPDNKTAVSLDVRLPQTYRDERGLFGVWGTCGCFPQSSRIFACMPGIDTNAANYILQSGYGSDSWGEDRHILKIGDGELSLDGVAPTTYYDNSGKAYTAGFNHDGWPTTRRLPLFTLFNRTGDGAAKSTCNSTFLYDCLITTNRVAARRLVPGVIGTGNDAKTLVLFDDVTRTVLRSTDNGHFSVSTVQRGEPLTDLRAESSAVYVPTRTIASTAVDYAQRRVTLTFGGSAVTNLLFAVSDRRGDRGTDPADWADAVYLGKILPAETSKVVSNVPSVWWFRAGAIRFVLLPADHFPYDVRLEYLSSDPDEKGNQYVKTGFYPTPDSEIVIKTRHKINDIAAFGLMEPSDFYSFPHSNADLYSGFFGNGKSLPGAGVAKAFITEHRQKTFATTPAYEVRLNKDGVWFPTLDNQAIGAFTPTKSEASARDVWLFCARYGDSSLMKRTAQIAIYSVKLSDGGVLKRDLVPCRANGVAKFYDTVTGTYFGNAGTGVFTEGAEVDPLVTEREPQSVSEAIVTHCAGLFFLVR